MRTPQEYEAAHALYKEAVAAFEAAKAQFDALETLIQQNLRAGKPLTSAQHLEEDLTRDTLYAARVRLSWHQHRPE